MNPTTVATWTVLLQGGMLVLVRTASVMVAAPVFGQREIPVMTKVAFCLLLTLLLMPVLPLPKEPLPSTVLAANLCIQAILGLLQGLLFTYILATLTVAGDFIDLQAGVSMASTIDPGDTTPHSVFSRIFGAVAAVVFLSMDGHLMILESTIKSLRFVPVGQLHVPTTLSLLTVERGCALMGTALRLAAPTLAILAMVDVATAFLSRSLPQLQILQAIPAVKLLLVLFTLGIFLPAMLEGLTSEILRLHGLLR